MQLNNFALLHIVFIQSLPLIGYNKLNNTVCLRVIILFMQLNNFVLLHIDFILALLNQRHISNIQFCIIAHCVHTGLAVTNPYLYGFENARACFKNTVDAVSNMKTMGPIMISYCSVILFHGYEESNLKIKNIF